MKIVRRQFTRWDTENYPECNNAEYLEYERVETGLSSEIIAYGYREEEQVGNVTKFKWIKKPNPPIGK